MTIKYYTDLVQGSEEWFSARLGILTASEMKLIISPKDLDPANNDKEKAHVYEIASQRISGYVEPHYVGEDMMRGHVDEIDARILYDKNYAPVKDTGFITNDKWGFLIGYSPDGLVDLYGGIECKSRRQRFQIETIVTGEMPKDFTIQVQTGLLVSEREWIDFITYSGGLPMYTIRIFPDKKIQDAIVIAAEIFEKKVNKAIKTYHEKIAANPSKFIPTERRKPEEEITV